MKKLIEFYKKAKELYWKVFNFLLNTIMVLAGIYGLYEIYVLGKDWFWNGFPFILLAYGIFVFWFGYFYKDKK